MSAPPSLALAFGLTFFALAACATPGAPVSPAQSGGAAEAIVNTAMGLTASGISRAQGGCYAACPAGTACDGTSGMCQPLPCRDQCAADEYCDEVTNTCVEGTPPTDLGARRTQEPIRGSEYWDRTRPADPAPKPE